MPIEEEKSPSMANTNGHDDVNDVWEATCPVCLSEDARLVRGQCGHLFCLPCLKRVFSRPIHRDSREDSHLDVPTRGRCPMCRSELCLFDLAYHKKAEEGTTLRDDPIVIKHYDLAKTDLQGRVYKEQSSNEGCASLHFPPFDNENGDDGCVKLADQIFDETATTTADHKAGERQQLPYLNLSATSWTFRGGASVPHKKYFEPGCFFHEETRTFCGRIVWGDTSTYCLFGSLEWEYVLTFSSDYQFIARGVIVHKKLQNVLDELEFRYPMDGRWSVVSVDTDGKRSSPPLEFLVHNNKGYALSHGVRDRSVAFSILYTDQKYPKVCWEGDECTHIANHDLAEADITVGESLEFRSSTGAAVVSWFRMLQSSAGTQDSHTIWTRETISSIEMPLLVVQIGGTSGFKYCHARLTGNVDALAPVHQSSTLWGNTFCQSLIVGLASYHFMEDIEHGAYISYEHEETSVWPPLDNGNPIPARIWFSETSFDAEERIFRGKINWEEAYQTTWQGCRWWRYEMHFDEEYSYITGGFVKSVPLGSNIEMDMSTFGVELVYMNAAVLEQFYEEANSQGRNPISQVVRPYPWAVTCRFAQRTRVRYPRSFES